MAPRKRKSTATAAKPAKKPKQEEDESSEEETEVVEAQVEEEAPALDTWRVVLTGDFVVKPKVVLEKVLKGKGVAVTQAISGKTTHLLLGKSGVNEYGKKTGVGSSKYNQAVEKGLTILSEKEAWAILSGNVTAQQLSDRKQAAKVSATKSSSLADKVVFCIQEMGGGKASLPKLKKELTARFDMSFDNTRSKNSLNKALTTLVDGEKLEKEGASYRLPEAVDAATEVDADVEWTQEDDDAEMEARIAKHSPEVGRWRGLYVLATKKATGRAYCKACGQQIAKDGGQKQVQVSDDSLFRMCVWPEDAHEGVSRGYIECSYPGYDVISRNKFFIHENCHEAAEAQCEAQFRSDWAEVRPHEIAARRSYN